MKNHFLKTWPIYYERILNGQKTFEVRKNDRDFQAGDTVTLAEFHPDGDIGFSNREIHFIIGYVLVGEQFGIQSGYCVFSLIDNNKSHLALKRI